MHDDNDIDSEVLEGILEYLFWWDDGPNWFTITLVLTAVCLALYHYFG